MKTLKGIPVSGGAVIGKAFLYRGNEFPEVPRYSVDETEAQADLARFKAAVAAARDEMAPLCERGGPQADIARAHLMMLEDPDFHDQIERQIRRSRRNAEWAVWDNAHGLIQKLMASPDETFRERAVDISDISKRILARLLAVERVSLADLDEDVILAAHDLLPSEVLSMNRERVKGIVMDLGSGTCHTAILARSFNIPAVLGLSTALREIAPGDTLIIDGASGEVYIDPDPVVRGRYRAALNAPRRAAVGNGLRGKPAETRDGRRVALKANLETPAEVDAALAAGAEGIGLYRSEFLFLSTEQAAEEEMQYEAYRRVFRACGDLPVTIRTVDIGGDKILPDFHASTEKNPLLGWRAIRFSLSLPDLFKTQLRAILRAAVHGNARIMFPLVAEVEELEQAMTFLDEALDECRARGQPAADGVPRGVMIEVPSAAVTADILARKADFFSIGTNDLLQYTLAVDRGNEKVGYLAQPWQPAVIRLLKTIIDAAHARGIPAAMCGEMAGDPMAAPLLLGLGLDEFSMAAPAIPQVKRVIRAVTMADCEALARGLLDGASLRENAAFINAWTAEHFSQET